MRYERRDPRPEDLREISELRTRCDSQERDLFVLTDRLREMQIQMSELQQPNGNPATTQRKKPPSKTIATSCDVIYEERETPEHDDDDDDEEDEKEENDEQQQEADQQKEHSASSGADQEEQGEQEPSDTESNHTIEVNGKCSDRINEDDTYMISAV